MYHIAIKEDINLISEQELSEALAKLPEWRREKALRFKYPSGKAECACSYLMLCNLLQEKYGITAQPHFNIGEHGKPTLLEYPDIHFNISHCKAAIAVAVSNHPIGIDVECIGRGNEMLANHVLNDDELHKMKSAADPKAAFTRLWTQKEALFKLLATGITDDIKELLRRHPDVCITTQTNTEKGYALSIARYSE